ncbi:MAG: S-layer homology domain-containing protein [Clostridia bacterium]|nr:S-layer homology domain-containing protein [Clostridia bacterium]
MKKLLSLLLVIIMAVGTASAVSVSAGKTEFTDVPSSHWSAPSIVYAVENGYMNGVGSGRFDPAGSLTRAMVATVLWRRVGEPKPASPSGFSDVKEGEWYSDAVSWAKETGVVNGMTDKTFSPKGLITREQLSAMLFRFSSLLVPDTSERADLSSFADSASVSVWAEEAVAWAAGAGLVKGTDGNRLDPRSGATREQFAAMIERFDVYVKNAEVPLVDADFYVSETGNDSWNGSFARPFRTIGRAVAAVREIPKTKDRGGITVAVRKGEYCLFDFDLTASDSGTADCPITYRAYGDGEVVITDRFEIGAERFEELDADDTVLFGRSAGKIKKADVSDLFPKNASTLSYTLSGENGELWPARYPNKYDDGEEVFFPGAVDVTGSMTLKMKNAVLSNRIAKYRTLKGVNICGNLCYYVYFEHVEISSYDADSGTATVAYPEELRSYPWFGGFRYVTKEDGTVDPDKTVINSDSYVEGAAEELDAQGEFYMDAASGVLYVFSPSGGFVFEAKEPDPNTAAEYVAFDGIRFPEEDTSEYETPIVYLDKTGDDGFRVLNLSDPQLTDNEWNGNAGELLTETVTELVRTESPDLITVSGDLAWGGSYGSCANLADLLAGTGVSWAFVLGNHDHEISDAGLIEKIGLLTSRDGCLFKWGDKRLGCGNYVIVLRRNGVPVHGLIMMDTHSNITFIDNEGEAISGYADLTEEQIKWYGDVCDTLTAMGVKETTMISHIPCYTYREAFAAALLPGIDPKTVPAGDGMQVGYWAPGYEDSFGVLHESGIASADRDNGFFDAVLAHGSTKTLIAGHDHINNFSIPYRGVRFVYSLKAGSGCYWEPELNGGTLIDVSSDGTATVRHHYIVP